MSNLTPPPDLPGQPLRALVADDEPTARRGVRLLLEKENDITVVADARDGLETIAKIRELKPDLVFLDVQMPGADGFDVIGQIGSAGMPAVVFITAYDEYALRAFDVNAVDYLLKPYEDSRFRAATTRVREAARQRKAASVNAKLTQLLHYLETTPASTAAQAAREPFPDRILIKTSGEIFFLKPEEVDWIEAEGDYMVFHVGGKTHLLRETMARLEARLDPKKFIRIHRSTIVNIDRVKKLSPSFVGEYAVVLHDGTKMKLSRSYQERLQALLKSAL
jgi:two-component system LytT family response regulator